MCIRDRFILIILILWNISEVYTYNDYREKKPVDHFVAVSHSWDACPIRLVSVFWPVAARAIFSARVRPLGNLRVWKGFYEYSTRDQTENRISFRAIQKIKYKLIFSVALFSMYGGCYCRIIHCWFTTKNDHFYQPQEYLNKHSEEVGSIDFQYDARADQ